MEHIGMDLGKKESQLAILTEDGELIEKRIHTERSRLSAVFGARPTARILLEAATESEWVARCLEALGHEVIVADPNFAPMYAQRSRRIKTAGGMPGPCSPRARAGPISPRIGPPTRAGIFARSWLSARGWSGPGPGGSA